MDRDNQELINLCTEGLDNSRCEVTYKLDITNIKRTTSGSETDVILIENEQFSLKILDSLNNVVMPKQVFVDTTESLCNFKMQSFGNKTKFKLLTGDDEEVQAELFKNKAITRANSQSFIFSKDFFCLLYNRYLKDVEKNKTFSNILTDMFIDYQKIRGMSDSELNSSTVEDFYEKVFSAACEQ